MTIIAYKSGLLCSDSCIADENVIVGSMKKVTRATDGTIAGAAGLASSVGSFLSWVEKGRRPRNKPDLTGDEDFAGITVMKDGEVVFYDAPMTPMRVTDEFFALGSGADVAIGAMEFGADPVDAVRVAIRRKFGCRGPIQAVRLDGKKHNFGPKGNQ